MNAYATVAMVKDAMRRTAATDTGDDVEIARINERVARGLDRQIGRHFYTYTGSRYYQGTTGKRLWLADDVLSISALLVDDDGDNVPETAYTENTDFILWPYNAAAKNEPYRALELLPDATGAWPVMSRGVKVTGVFGFSDDTELVGLTGTLSDASDTSLTTSASAASLVGVGDTLVIENEQLEVTAVVTTTVTVVRGINGTTAVGHTAAAISRRRYPADIEEIAVLDAVRLLREGQTGAGGYAGAAEFGGYQFSASYPRISEVIRTYRIGW